MKPDRKAGVTLRELKTIRLEVVVQGLKEALLASGTVVLLAASITGCAQAGHTQERLAQNVDCRSCHSPNGTSGAKDFGKIYASPASHHPVGIKYPDPAARPDLKQPNGNGGTRFFDRNGDGQPDMNEIQLFSANGFATVECASCHEEHGEGHAAAGTTKSYLRVDNSGSALCITCHSY